MSDSEEQRTERYPEYPTGELDALTEQATQEFNNRVSEHGRGKNWLSDEPRFHLFKATDELFLARGREAEGDIAGMEQHESNALNHMLFALEIAQDNQTPESATEHTDSE